MAVKDLVYGMSIGALVPSIMLLQTMEKGLVRELPKECNVVLDIDLWLAPTSIYPHLECMGSIGRRMYLDFYNFDLLLFPLIYGTFLFVSLARVWPNYRLVWMLPVLSSCCDVLENFCMYFLLVQFPRRYETLEHVISVFSRVKWHSGFIAGGILILGVLLKIVRKWKATEPNISQLQQEEGTKNNVQEQKKEQ